MTLPDRFLNIIKSLLVSCAVILLVACSNNSNEVDGSKSKPEQQAQSPSEVSKPNKLDIMLDDFLGCYSDKKDKDEAVLMVSKEGGEYHISSKGKDGWKGESPLVYGDKSDETLKKFLKDDLQYLDAALYSPKGAFAIFKFEDGADIKVKDPSSDYVAFLALVAGPVYKVACN